MYNQQSPLSVAQLDAAQSQIDNLRRSLLNPTPTYPQYPNYNQPVDIQTQIRNEVNAYLGQLQGTPTPTQPSPEPQHPLTTELDNFLTSMFSEEQISWLKDPVIINTLPVFFKSDRGKSAVSLIFEEFKSYINR